MIRRICILAAIVCVVLGQTDPNFYDFRKSHPKCVGGINHYKNCNSSWAFAFSGMMADRLCKKNNAYLKLSAQDLICQNQTGCSGKFTEHDLEKGVADEVCLPYGDSMSSCKDGKCINGAEPKRYKCEKLNSTIDPGIIKTEISTHGPVMCVFQETIDHEEYYDGVYYRAHPRKKHTYDTAYKVVGYGVENGMQYWIGEQSRSEEFGENGYVRYKITEELCGKVYSCKNVVEP